MKAPKGVPKTNTAVAHQGAWGILALCLCGTAAHAGPARDPASASGEREIVVIGANTSGSIPEDRVPANVVVLHADSIAVPGIVNVQDALSRRLGSINIVDSLGQSLQSGITLRGFTAAPALGEPQGIAIYQGAMRVNEAFGDVVQWDLLPTFAIDEVQVVPGSNPVYGLNGIGGAVILRMKNGFNNPGGRAEAAYGRFGRYSAMLEYGARMGNIGLYAGGQAIRDDGWRNHSPSSVHRGFVDLGWRDGDRSEIGVSFNAARSKLTGNGPAPADLLAEDRRGVFTYPDATRNRMAAISFRGKHAISDALRVELGGYYRYLRRGTANGDQAEFKDCAAFNDLDAPPGALCFGAEANDDDAIPEILIGDDGQAITGFDAGDADAVFNRTRTRTHGSGVSAQLVWKERVAGMENVLIVGGTVDIARTHYESGTELGVLQPDRGVESLGPMIGNELFNVGLKTHSQLDSAYATDTLSLTRGLHLTGSVKWTRAELRLRDQFGTSLDGDHVYDRFDPAVGLAFNPTADVTLYSSYTRNSRVPTPAELSCADPARPCRFPNAFLADPPLDEVRARTIEVGAKGHFHLAGHSLDFSLAGFRTINRDDIIFISAGPIIGTGYFANVDRTRRIGIEAALEGRMERLGWSLSYAYVCASYGTSLKIQSPDNPFADSNGEIFVERGDRLPGIPLHSLKLTADYAVTDALTFGIEGVVSGNRYLRGDESNQNPPIPGFAVFAARANYRAGPFEIFGRVDNLLGERYETFGIFGQAGDLGFSDPRFLSPALPRSFTIGLRAAY